MEFLYVKMQYVHWMRRARKGRAFGSRACAKNPALPDSLFKHSQPIIFRIRTAVKTFTLYRDTLEQRVFSALNFTWSDYETYTETDN